MTRYLQSLKHKGTRTGVIIATVVGIVASVSLFSNSAGAAVVQDHNKGFDNSTVLGDNNSGWFGPYGIVYQGQALDGFCIDHGNHIMPNTDYVWSQLDTTNGLKNLQGATVSKQNAAAISWLVGTYANSTDGGFSMKVNNAAIELAEQDLMGSPYGTTGAPLNVDTLKASDFQGEFGAEAGNVAAQAKKFKAYGLSRGNLVSRNDLANAYNLNISLTPKQPGPNDVFTVAATLTDTKGQPIPGITLGIKIPAGGTVIDPIAQKTGDHGVSTWRVKNDGGDHATNIGVTSLADKLPLSTPLVYQSNGGSQRVVVQQYAVVNATAKINTVGGREIKVHKNGDNEPYLSVAGAKFNVVDSNGVYKGQLTTNAQGDTGTISVPAGVYTVKERVAPDGYQLDPQDQKVDVTAPQTGPAVVTFKDASIPGSFTLKKVDADDTTKLLGGAKFTLSYDKNNDGKFTVINDHIVTVAGQVSTFKNLKPGHYLLTEVSPPAGYSFVGDKTVPFGVAPGKDTTVEVKNSKNSELIKGIKTDDTGKKPLAGAVIDLYRKGDVVSPPAPPTNAAKFPGYTWVGRDTSDAKGQLDFGQRETGNVFCYNEIVAPAGYVATAGLQCPVAEPLKFGTPIDFQIKNKPYGRIIGNKFDSATQAPLQGAVFDLYRQLGKDETAAAPSTQPDDAESFDGFVWVARATSDEKGQAVFGTFVPGSVYCAFESTVPAGYETDGQMHCMSAAMTTDDVVLQLPNTAVPVVLAVVETPPQPVVQSETLAKTGGQWIQITLIGLGLIMTGRLFMIISARRKKPRWMV